MGILNKESTIDPLAVLESVGFHLKPSEDEVGTWIAIKKWDACGVRIIHRPGWPNPWAVFIFDSHGSTYNRCDSFDSVLNTINNNDGRIIEA